MNKILSIFILSGVVFLGACDHYSTKLAAFDSAPRDFTQISPASGGEMTFSRHLANEYLALARYENDTKKDYRAAKYYTEKLERLNQGEMVTPATINDFNIAEEKAPVVETARSDLLAALQIYNIPENREALAKAQSRYDCWLEQLEERPDGDVPLTCEIEYQQAMAALALPFNRDIRYAVPFSEDGSMMNEQASLSMGRVLNLWNRHQMHDINISLLPPYSVPAEQAAEQISRVRTILQYNGIPAEKIQVMTSTQEILVPKNNLEIIMRINAPEQEIGQENSPAQSLL